MVDLTTLLYILPLTFADNFLSHRTPETFLQLIHPAWILLLTSSHLPSLLTVEPRYFLLSLPFLLAAIHQQSTDKLVNTVSTFNKKLEQCSSISEQIDNKKEDDRK